MEAVEIFPRTSLVYEYGARVEHEADVAAAIERQAKLAHESYNRMVETCRAVFGEIMSFCRKQDADIAHLEQRIEELSQRFKDAKAKDDRDALRTIATERRALRQTWREKVWAVRNTHLKDIRETYLSRVDILKKSSDLYAIRSESTQIGLYWATANEVMRRVKQAFDKALNRLQPVRFQKWSERDQDTLVIQVNDRTGGLTVDEMHAGGYPTLCVRPLPPSDRRRSKNQCYTPFRFRVAPSPRGKGHRGGIDATGTVYWHRDLPPDARITYARLVRRRTASHWRTYLQFVVTLEKPISTIPLPTDRGIAGLDLNWHFDNEQIGRRIAAVSHDGRTGDLLYLDPKHGSDLESVDELNERRSRARDQMVEILRGLDWKNSPQELSDFHDYLKRNTRSQDIAYNRLASGVWLWKSQCPEWEKPALIAAEAWRKRDKKMWEAASHRRRKANHRRDKQYQALARTLVAENTLLLIDRPSLRHTALVTNEHTGRHNVLGATSRGGRHEVALSKFEHWLTTKAAETGTQLVRVDGRTTWTCSACGAEVTKPSGEAASARTWACPNCGVVHDRDVNAACNVWQMAETRRDEIEVAVKRAEQRVSKKLRRRTTLKTARTDKLKGRPNRASATVTAKPRAALESENRDKN